MLRTILVGGNILKLNNYKFVTFSPLDLVNDLMEKPPLINLLYFNDVLEENSSSLISLERSSGYESFNTNSEDFEYWQMSSNNNRHKKTNISSTIIDDNEQLSSSASAGPFLTILMEKLRNFLSNSFYINLHLTGLISRLAAYPQPLLRAYLLDHSLVLQPNVPSLFEVRLTTSQFFFKEQ